jgi:Domain of unknown function (DUF4124)
MKQRVGIALGVFLSLPAAAGGVYRWLDEQGQMHFGDRPPVGATLIKEEARPASGDTASTGSGLRAGERARLGEIRQRESREAAERRERDKRAAADERRRARETGQDAKRCTGYRQKISEYKRRLRAGCRVSTCNSYDARIDDYQRMAAEVCR